jgi:8-oxo-dGTP pyrophosphatase MutT (NUDIX family)
MTDDTPGTAGDIRQRATREVYRNPWLRLREDEIEYADGSTGSYAIVEKPDFVTVLPLADEGFWLVQQYRYAVGSREWEFPQGGWSAGHSGTQQELAAAELAEETGLRAERFTHLGRLFASYGYSSQAFDVFLATGLTEGEHRREATEQDMVHRWFPADEVRAMIRAGSFADSHSVAALALFELRRSGAA